MLKKKTKKEERSNHVNLRERHGTGNHVEGQKSFQVHQVSQEEAFTNKSLDFALDAGGCKSGDVSMHTLKWKKPV